MKKLFWVGAVLLGVWLCGPAMAGGLADDCKKISSAGMKFIANHQNSDGSYGQSDNPEAVVNTTAVVVYAMAAGERKYRYDSGPFLSDAVDFLLKSQSADGSFGSATVTGNVVLALRASKFAGAAEAIAKAEAKYPQFKQPAGKAAPDHLKQEPLGFQLVADWSALTPDAAAAGALIQKLLGLQDQKSKDPKQFGRVTGLGEGYDPVMATAVSVILADAIAADKRFAK